MANEVQIIELLGNNGDQVSFTCATGTAIAKGAILKMTDPRTCIINSGAGNVLCGITAFEKSATDGVTQMSVITNCIGRCYVEAGKTVTLGSCVRVAATVNQIEASTSLDQETGKALGVSLETGAATELVAVRIKTL